MRLETFIIKRLFLMLVVLFGVSVVVFVVARAIPADPVGAILGGNAPLDVVEDMTRRLGLDKPLFDQFVDFITGAARGDLGVSIKSNRPVIKDIAEFFPATLELAIVAALISVLLGVPLGIFFCSTQKQTNRSLL